MATTVSDFIVERLYQWGVRRMFGYPGDGINGMFGALRRSGEKIAFVQARHEEMAAFMASAHAKFTGELGVCIATSGPGAAHLLTGLYDARLDHMPVLAIAGQQARAALGAHYQQEVDLAAMFKDVAGAFVQQASVPAQVRHMVDRAVRIALSRRTVTALILPNDLQELEYEPPPRKHGTAHSGVGYVAPEVVPRHEDLARAAEVLNAGRRVAMLVGAGAMNATDEVIAVADRLGAGVAKALLGKAAVPDDLPWVTGSIGLLGTKPTDEMMSACDTLLMVGSGFPYSEFLPKEGDARGVQIDIDAGMLSVRYPMEVSLVGDSAATLRALLPLLDQKDAASWRDRIVHANGRWQRVLDERARRHGRPRESAARVHGAFAAPARRRDSHERFGFLCKLVRARPEDPARHEVLALGRSRLDGRRRAVCDRREVRVSAPSRDRAGGRRRDADEQHGRVDHGREVLENVERSPLDLHGAQQRGSEPGHLGAARDGRRSEVRGVAAHS